ncbi:aryl-alcohol oxidase [Mucidula mucida]|nr:aryl-alcohol oxidase [Mucidula mucida]
MWQPALFIGLAAALASGKLIFSPADLSETEYDFIVVGAGTAGCVLAARLSENPDVKVLAIEAGGSNEGIIATIAPFLGVSLAGTSVDWNYTTVPLEGYDNRTLGFTRGFGLGGSSVVNLLTWNRGSIDLWNSWAEVTGDDGWSWNNMEEFWLKSNTLVAPADGHDTTGQVDPAVHGTNGNVLTSVPGFPTELDPLVVNASLELGGRYSYTVDINGGVVLGTSYMQSSVGGGERSSAATAYLYPVIDRDNLDVLVNTRVTKLIETGGKKSKPEIRAVQLQQTNDDIPVQIKASKEVIMSAGVIATPQILMLSGIGPRQDLRKLNIKPIVNLPDVGQHFADHPAVASYYLVNSNGTFDSLLRDTNLFGLELVKWNTTRQGRFVNSPANTYSFLRLPDDAAIYENFDDPSSGPTAGHMEIIFVDGFAAFGPLTQPATGSFLTILAGVVSPVSRGCVTINTTNPFADPLIDPAFLTNAFDEYTMVQVMKDTEKFLSASSWDGFIIEPYGDLADASTDELKLQYSRTYGSNINHPVGTARMSPKKAKWGVVDSELLLKGADGVRIVDASVFPSIPESHTQAPVYMVAERAAALIKSKYSL